MSNITESLQQSPNAGGEKSAAIQESLGVVPNNHDHTSALVKRSSAIQESPGVVPNNHDHTSAVVKRSSAIGLAIVFLVASLFGFSKVGHLDKWEQRGFNSLAILFTGIMSLGLGSLVGYMGSMIKWPLLARGTYGARDVSAGRLFHVRKWTHERIGRPHLRHGTTTGRIAIGMAACTRVEMDTYYIHSSTVLRRQYIRSTQRGNPWADVQFGGDAGD